MLGFIPQPDYTRVHWTLLRGGPGILTTWLLINIFILHIYYTTYELEDQLFLLHF